MYFRECPNLRLTSHLAVHWHSRILGFYSSAFARKPSKSGPGGPDSSPPGPGKPSFSFRGVDDFSPGLEGRVGDQFWHPQGVQVKAPNSRILISPLQWTAEVTSRCNCSGALASSCFSLMDGYFSCWPSRRYYFLFIPVRTGTRGHRRPRYQRRRPLGLAGTREHHEN